MGAVSYPPVPPDRQLARRRALEHVLLAVLPVVLTGWVVYHVYASGIAAVDFQHSFWVAGWRTLHGLDPYAWTRSQISGGVSFPYPALTALLLSPFGLVSSFPESIPVTAAAIVAAPLSLWILRVRDWRVYGAVALWAPVVVGWQSANFTLALIVGIALLWRFRHRPLLTAALVACLVSIKPILVPVWFWLLLTRRWRAAAISAAIGITLNAVSWTVLGWHELSRWVSLLSLQGRLQNSTGYSLIALASHLGLGRTFGYALIVALSCLLVGTAVALAKTGQEEWVFGVAVLLTIVISPQADAHYFAMLLVPLALIRPRLFWAWLAPLVLWVCPATQSHSWQIVLWWALGVAVLAGLVVPAADDRGNIGLVRRPRPA